MVTFDEEAAKATERTYLSPEIAHQRLRTLDALALRSGERVIDVGCGPGLLARDMALRVGPKGQVLAVDPSGPMRALAEQRCGDMPQVSVADGGAEALPADNASCNAAACTQVLLYVKDVPAALAELYRVLKPGGRLAVVETDWRGVVLNSTDGELTDRVFAAWDSAVPSSNLPPRLTPLLRERGFAAIRTEAVPILNTSMAPGNYSTDMVRFIGEHAEREGLVDAADVAAWREDLARLGDRDEYFFCVNRFLFTAVKI